MSRGGSTALPFPRSLVGVLQSTSVILAIGIPNKRWRGINFRLASANLRFRIYSRPGRCRGWLPVQLEERLPHARYPECDMSRGPYLMGFTVREFPGLCMYRSVVGGTSARVSNSSTSCCAGINQHTRDSREADHYTNLTVRWRSGESVRSSHGTLQDLLRSVWITGSEWRLIRVVLTDLMSRVGWSIGRRRGRIYTSIEPIWGGPLRCGKELRRGCYNELRGGLSKFTGGGGAWHFTPPLPTPEAY